MQTAGTQSPAHVLGRHRIAASARSVFSGAVFLLACALAVVVWRALPAGVDYPIGVVVLAGSLPLAAHASLRLQGGARLYFTGASILFIVTLLPPSLAMTAMGAGMAAKELTICRRCQNQAWQVLGQVGRWMLIGLCASLLVHLTNVLAASAVIGAFLWGCDVLTAPLVLRTESSLLALYRSLIARSWNDELMQYLTGALLVPVVLLERQDTLVVAAAVAVLALWLFMFYMMHDPAQRQSG